LNTFWREEQIDKKDCSNNRKSKIGLAIVIAQLARIAMEEQVMNKRIAVIYKSVYGATEHYARWIADALART
jgi:hypothetical protein